MNKNAKTFVALERERERERERESYSLEKEILLDTKIKTTISLLS